MQSVIKVIIMGGGGQYSVGRFLREKMYAVSFSYPSHPSPLPSRSPASKSDRQTLMLGKSDVKLFVVVVVVVWGKINTPY